MIIPGDCPAISFKNEVSLGLFLKDSRGISLEVSLEILFGVFPGIYLRRLLPVLLPGCPTEFFRAYPFPKGFSRGSFNVPFGITTGDIAHILFGALLMISFFGFPG